MAFGEHYTAEENEWIKENYPLIGKKNICEEFNQHFNSNRKHESMWSHIRRMGITGNENFRVKRCKESFGVPIGTEHINKQGYILVKTKDVNGGRSKNWELKQRVMWRNAHGEIPSGSVITFIDGNIQNCELSNLACIPNEYLRTMVSKGWISENNVLTETGIIWCQLNKLVGSNRETIYRDDIYLVH